MADIWFVGFDDTPAAYNDPTQMQMRCTSIVGAINSGVTGRRTGSKALNVNSEGIVIWAFADKGHIFTGCAWDNAYSSTSGTNRPGFQICYSGAILCSFQANYNGDPASARLLDATGNPVFTMADFQNNLKSFIEIELVPGRTGTITLRVNQATKYTGTGNFGNPGGGADFLNANQVRCYAGHDTNATIQDLYVVDNTGARNNSFLGDIAIISDVPTADTDVHDQTPNTGTVHFDRVNETPCNFDSSWVNATAVSNRDLYTFPAVSTPAGYSVVRAMQIITYCRTDVGGSSKIQGSIRQAGVITNSPDGDKIVNASYYGIAHIYDLNPATGLPWLVSEIPTECGDIRTV